MEDGVELDTGQDGRRDVDTDCDREILGRECYGSFNLYGDLLPLP